MTEQEFMDAMQHNKIAQKFVQVLKQQGISDTEEVQKLMALTEKVSDASLTVLGADSRSLGADDFKQLAVAAQLSSIVFTRMAEVVVELSDTETNG